MWEDLACLGDDVDLESYQEYCNVDALPLDDETVAVVADDVDADCGDVGGNVLHGVVGWPDDL